jgi:hypothetical protein
MISFSDFSIPLCTMIPKLDEVEMCLNRDLVDPNFNSYKLNLDTLPVRHVHDKIINKMTKKFCSKPHLYVSEVNMVKGTVSKNFHILTDTDSSKKNSLKTFVGLPAITVLF